MAMPTYLSNQDHYLASSPSQLPFPSYGYHTPQSSSQPIHHVYHEGVDSCSLGAHYCCSASNIPPSYLPSNRSSARAQRRPFLPPIKVPQSSMDDYHVVKNGQLSHLHERLSAKEEKAVGGVAAYLDYEMEHMVSFVAESAQGMYELYQSGLCLADVDIVRSILPRVLLSPSFRKYVSQILTSTRLPSSTILLGLHYLATRMTFLSSQGIYTAPTKLCNLITTALMLGSKFLDDNTFQNRSWAEVSGASTSELTTLELEWLTDMKWDLHFDEKDPSGYTAWLAEWQMFQSKKVQAAMSSLKLTPLESCLPNRPPPFMAPPLTPLYTPTFNDMNSVPYPTDRSPSHWPMWSQQRYAMDRSPPSAPHTGPPTPDWYGRHSSPRYHLAMASAARVMPPLLPGSMAPKPLYYAPYGAQPFTPNPWNGHNHACLCSSCLPSHERFSLAHGYGMQSVAG